MNKKRIEQMIEKYYLELSTLTVFTKAEHQIHRNEYQTIKKFNLPPAQFGVLEKEELKRILKKLSFSQMN